MKHRQFVVNGIGGLQLFAQSWLPEQPASAVIVVAHGLGEHSSRYRELAESLVADGRAVYAIDHRGHGRLAMVRLLSIVAPNTGALQLPAAAVSRDPAVVRAYESDPLVLHEAVPARTLVELLQAMATFPQQALELRLPVLIQHGTADSLVPLAATRDVYQAIAARDRIFMLYEGLYHEIYNEPERERVTADLRKWLAVRAAH